MVARIKLLGAETEVANTTPDDLNNSTVVRIYAPTDSVVTVKNAGGDTLGSMTVPQGVIEILEKSPTDTLEASTAVKCAPIAFR